MGRNKYFESKRKPIERRRSETRIPKPPAILIITEGKKTEPLYFQGLVDYISNKYGGSNIDINPAPKLEISGKGMVSVSLVREAIRVVQHARRPYSEVWVVFDKDDNRDFDEAIDLAKRNDIQVAWNNSCFEYWLMLHFKEDSVARTPADWKSRLDSELKKAKILQVDYDKANTELSEIPLKKGLLKKAVENAGKREQQQTAVAPSKQDPGTTVHHLINSLKPYIGELL